MSDSFELDRAAPFTLPNEIGVDDTPDLTLAETVALRSDDPRYRDASAPVLRLVESVCTLLLEHAGALAPSARAAAGTR
jgi:hypothetical protein